MKEVREKKASDYRQDVRMNPTHPIFLPCEAIAILEHMDATRWAGDDGDKKLREAIREYLGKADTPSKRDLYVLRVMHSPKASANYPTQFLTDDNMPVENNATAVKRILNKEASLPWSIDTERSIECMWKLMFINKLGRPLQIQIGRVIDGFYKMLTTQTSIYIDRDSNWNYLMLRYSFLTMKVCKAEEMGMLEETDEVLYEWKMATEDLLWRLESREKERGEEWAKVLLWRLSIDYVAFIYNMYFFRKVVRERRTELTKLLESTRFLDRSNLYGLYLATAPRPFLNRIVVYSSILNLEDEYGTLWEDFIGCWNRMLSTHVHENELMQCVEYARNVVQYLHGDSDLAHFREWLIDGEYIMEGSVEKWFYDKYPMLGEEYWEKKKEMKEESRRKKDEERRRRNASRNTN